MVTSNQPPTIIPALQQVLNNNNRIYQGRDDLFKQLVDYYCRQEKIVKMAR